MGSLQTTRQRLWEHEYTRAPERSQQGDLVLRQIELEGGVIERGAVLSKVVKDLFNK
jgi:hypothetical protein